MPSKYLNRVLLGLIFLFGLLLFGLILESLNSQPFHWRTHLQSIRDDGTINVDDGGFLIFLTVPFVLIYVIYSLIEYYSYRRRLAVESYYHPLDPSSRSLLEDEDNET